MLISLKDSVTQTHVTSSSSLSYAKIPTQPVLHFYDRAYSFVVAHNSWNCMMVLLLRWSRTIEHTHSKLL